MSTSGLIALLTLAGALAWALIYFAVRRRMIGRNAGMALALVVVLVAGVIFYYPSIIIVSSLAGG